MIYEEPQIGPLVSVTPRIARIYAACHSWIRGGLYGCIVLVFFLTLSLLPAGNRNAYPLPEERGTAGTLAALEKLPVYTRVLYITAHPDDESAGTLTWLSRQYHAQTALLCMTRGEGGQNILGKEKYEALGLVRTGELVEASKYYGIEVYFASVLDFGFSKTADETLSKWDHEATLEELVRFIRRWRPDIIISRFRGDPRDGHGHHQATGILAKEAFYAAADALKYPNHLSDRIQVWNTKKLYVTHLRVERELVGKREDISDWTVRVPVGRFDPVLGRSYREIGTEGYSKHRSQGSGTAFALPSGAPEYYDLVDSSVGTKAKEDSFFDSIDTSLMAIFDLAEGEKREVQFLKQDLAAAEKAASDALDAFQISNPEGSAAAISRGIEILSGSIGRIENSSLPSSRKYLLNDALKTKLKDFQDALSAVLGVSFIVRSENATNLPGGIESVTAYLYNRGNEPIYVKQIAFNAPGKITEAADKSTPLGRLDPGDSGIYRYSVEISPDTQVTQPFWYLANSHDTRYAFRPTEDKFASFGKPEISAQAIYLFSNVEVPVHATAMAQIGDPLRGADFDELQIVPAISLTLDPEHKIAPIRPTAREYEFKVSVLNDRNGEASGLLKLVAASELRVQPAARQFVLSRKGETFTANFRVQIPAETKAGNYPVEAVATSDGKEFRRGYQVVSYPENWTRNIYRPARSTLEVFKIETPGDLTVGYIMGAGDDIPGALEQLGIEVEQLSSSDLAFGDLNRFSVIVTGIRAYNVNEDLRANNQRLLDYVAQGGTLIVQYVRPMGRGGFGGEGSEFLFGPYPMSNSNTDRITVEESPIRILDPANPIFNTPNRISPDDFKGWVQERGLYFMNSWDSRYTPLLSGNDPGEDPKNGGMLMTRYGKGFYIYTAYAWFRQLPAGVPGAYRIFVNMLSLGQ
jgi:LmbE family N-acetylglucosaminyl deacetylase